MLFDTIDQFLRTLQLPVQLGHHVLEIPLPEPKPTGHVPDGAVGQRVGPHADPHDVADLVGQVFDPGTVPRRPAGPLVVEGDGLQDLVGEFPEQGDLPAQLGMVDAEDLLLGLEEGVPLPLRELPILRQASCTNSPITILPMSCSTPP